MKLLLIESVSYEGDYFYSFEAPTLEEGKEMFNLEYNKTKQSYYFTFCNKSIYKQMSHSYEVISLDDFWKRYL
jgi:hypothetical protein